jgi:hypothetical protein
MGLPACGYVYRSTWLGSRCCCETQCWYWTIAALHMIALHARPTVPEIFAISDLGRAPPFQPGPIELHTLFHAILYYNKVNDEHIYSDKMYA